MMQAIDILERCGEKRPTYVQLEAAHTLEEFSHGETDEVFPLRAEFGEAAELLSLAGVEGWDHLVEGGPEPGASTPAHQVQPAIPQEPEGYCCEEIILGNGCMNGLGDTYTAARLKEVLFENQVLRDKLRVVKALARR